MKYLTLLIGIIAFTMFSCGDSSGPAKVNKEIKTVKTKVVASTDPMDNKGLGPVKNVVLGDLNQKMADEGMAIFKAKCSACHKMEKKYVGPALAGVTKMRSPEWIMNMILNPEEMVKNDPIAKKLLAEFLSPMANQNMTKDEARKILEYFRTFE